MIVLTDEMHSRVEEPSGDFIAKLKAFDRDLTVFWNRLKQRWCIEQCVEHSGFNEDGTHSHLCRRIHVWLVQGEEKDYMPLCDRVIEKLAADRAFTEQFGDGPKSLERFKKYTASVQKDLDEKREKKQAEIAHDAAKDGKRQLEQVRTMMQRQNLGTAPK